MAELAQEHRLILKNGEILLPKSLRSQMLHNLHLTHSSDVYMIMNAKNKVFWPQMKADIRECSECLEFKRSKSKESTEVSYEQTCL